MALSCLTPLHLHTLQSKLVFRHNLVEIQASLNSRIDLVNISSNPSFVSEWGLETYKRVDVNQVRFSVSCTFEVCIND